MPWWMKIHPTIERYLRDRSLVRLAVGGAIGVLVGASIGAPVGRSESVGMSVSIASDLQSAAYSP
jgi:hypothetical protein